MTDPENFISVAGLKKRYGNFDALSSISFDARQGSTIALLGPSGCGKTTTLRCIAGLEEPDSGSIAIGGQIVFDSEKKVNSKPEERNLGVVFQSYAIWPHMTVAENVGFPLKLRRVGIGERTRRIDRILEIVGLSAWRDSPSTQLSGGQQQRVALARAVIHEPRLVLFDEPLSNLDAQLRDQMRFELKVLQEHLNFTAIYVTHDQMEALALAEKIIIMNRGLIEAIGSPEEIFERPPTLFIAKFLGLNTMEGVISRIIGGRGPNGGGWVEMKLQNGEVVKGVAPHEAMPEIGARAVVCFRKEAARLGHGDGNSLNNKSIFRGELKTKSYLGLHHEYLLRMGGSEIRLLSSEIVGAGDMVEICIDADECFIYELQE